MSYSIFVPKNKIIFSAYYQINNNLLTPTFSNCLNFLSDKIFSDIKFNSNYFEKIYIEDDYAEFYTKKSFVCYVNFLTLFQMNISTAILYLGKKIQFDTKILFHSSFKNVTLPAQPNSNRFNTENPLLFNFLENETVALAINVNNDQLLSTNYNYSSLEIFTKDV